MALCVTSLSRSTLSLTSICACRVLRRLHNHCRYYDSVHCLPQTNRKLSTAHCYQTERVSLVSRLCLSYPCIPSCLGNTLPLAALPCTQCATPHVQSAHCPQSFVGYFDRAVLLVAHRQGRSACGTTIQFDISSANTMFTVFQEDGPFLSPS